MTEAQRVMVQIRASCQAAGEEAPRLGPVAMATLQRVLDAHARPLPRRPPRVRPVDVSMDVLHRAGELALAKLGGGA